MAAPRAGTGSGVIAEHACEVALVGKTTGKSHVTQRKAAGAKHVAGDFHPPLEQPAVGGDARAAAERAREMAGRQSAFLG